MSPLESLEAKDARYKALAQKAAELADSLQKPPIDIMEFEDFKKVLKDKLTPNQRLILSGFASLILEPARNREVNEVESQE